MCEIMFIYVFIKLQQCSVPTGLSVWYSCWFDQALAKTYDSIKSHSYHFDLLSLIYLSVTGWEQKKLPVRLYLKKQPSRGCLNRYKFIHYKNLLLPYQAFAGAIHCNSGHTKKIVEWAFWSAVHRNLYSCWELQDWSWQCFVVMLGRDNKNPTVKLPYQNWQH